MTLTALQRRQVNDTVRRLIDVVYGDRKDEDECAETIRDILLDLISKMKGNP